MMVELCLGSLIIRARLLKPVDVGRRVGNG